MAGDDRKGTKRLVPRLDRAVVRSIAERGDLSGLTPEEKARLYRRMCKGLGLDAATQPFAFLVLDGREKLYATRGATDQLARIHHITREITDGPKVVTVGGADIVVATCRATMPDGRTETATGAYPSTDPVLAIMTAETKARRRATLSILGLGMLDDLEVHPLAPAGASATPREEPAVPLTTPVELDGFKADVLALEKPQDAATLWHRCTTRHTYWTKGDIATEAVAWKSLCEHLVERWKIRNVETWLRVMVVKIHAAGLVDEVIEMQGRTGS